MNGSVWRACRVCLVICATLVGCGGKGKRADTGPQQAEPTGDEELRDENMIPPEKMDAIQRELDRKRTVASRCLTSAIESGDAPKNARGKVTYEFMIGKDGRARDVEVVKASLESKQTQECVADLIRKIDFGSLSRELEWSYTFAFEAF
jgi:hypothetical protein